MAHCIQTNAQVDGPRAVSRLAEAAVGRSTPIVNAMDAIRANPAAKRFEIGDVLFAEFSCPGETVIWTQTDYLMHVTRGTIRWKQAGGVASATAGEAVFFRKGVYVVPEHTGHDLCVELYFIPDDFVRRTIQDLASQLPASVPNATTSEAAISVADDLALSAFFRAMAVYFASQDEPPEALLKLKLAELLTGVLLSSRNPLLRAYLWSIAAGDAPAVQAIMEANWQHNLPLTVFARMCHRSLSSFKRDFRKHYGSSPGKWLTERRLQWSLSLLRTTHKSITEITFECGFQDLSHFSHAFKEKFGLSPSLVRRGRDVAACEPATPCHESVHSTLVF